MEFIYLFSPPSYVALWDSKNTPQTRQWEGFLVFGNFSLKTLFLGQVSIPNSFLSFYLLYFVLLPFEDNEQPFWVPRVLCQHSEVVLWNLLSVQMFFWWICGEESGLLSYSSAILGLPSLPLLKGLPYCTQTCQSKIQLGQSLITMAFLFYFF